VRFDPRERSNSRRQTALQHPHPNLFGTRRRRVGVANRAREAENERVVFRLAALGRVGRGNRGLCAEQGLLGPTLWRSQRSSQPVGTKPLHQPGLSALPGGPGRTLSGGAWFLQADSCIAAVQDAIPMTSISWPSGSATKATRDVPNATGARKLTAPCDRTCL